MSEPPALAVVDAFLQAIEARDFERARSCLADSGFHYRGAIGSFDDAAAFVADLSRLGPILTRLERRKCFVDGDDVCVILNLVTSLAELSQTRLALWVKTAGGRIATIEVFFDARPYAQLFDPPLDAAPPP